MGYIMYGCLKEEKAQQESLLPYKLKKIAMWR